MKPEADAEEAVRGICTRSRIDAETRNFCLWRSAGVLRGSPDVLGGSPGMLWGSPGEVYLALGAPPSRHSLRPVVAGNLLAGVCTEDV